MSRTIRRWFASIACLLLVVSFMFSPALPVRAADQPACSQAVALPDTMSYAGMGGSSPFAGHFEGNLDGVGYFQAEVATDGTSIVLALAPTPTVGGWTTFKLSNSNDGGKSFASEASNYKLSLAGSELTLWRTPKGSQSSVRAPLMRCAPNGVPMLSGCSNVTPAPPAVEFSSDVSADLTDWVGLRQASWGDGGPKATLKTGVINGQVYAAYGYLSPTDGGYNTTTAAPVDGAVVLDTAPAVLTFRLQQDKSILAIYKTKKDGKEYQATFTSCG